MSERLLLPPTPASYDKLKKIELVEADYTRPETVLAAFKIQFFNLPFRVFKDVRIISQVSYLMSSYHLPNVLSRYSDTAVFCSSI
jgi:hypothetical protein